MASTDKRGFVANAQGLKELRQSPAVHKMLIQLAQEVQAQASDSGQVEGYKVTDLVLEEPRGAVSVMATGHARNHNRREHALVKALIQTKV